MITDPTIILKLDLGKETEDDDWTRMYQVGKRYQSPLATMVTLSASISAFIHGAGYTLLQALYDVIDSAS
jgi:hypothetical protein